MINNILFWPDGMGSRRSLGYVGMPPTTYGETFMYGLDICELPLEVKWSIGYGPETSNI
ncbi:hypothetical protein [Microbulbifer sp. TYP-18]|uniref:hypothetical protein n=1 Tax=Microbulbifer sp. TYP-18 TaxID=3230024 RepID=UPI0034C6458E